MNDIYFAPQLYIKSGIKDVSFYTKAFGAEELRRFSNDDGSIHVVEFSVNGTLFHLHEEKPEAGEFDPGRYNGTTVMIGLFVPDVDELIKNALAAGATLITPAQNYDYGYRQAEIRDPFGHYWMIEKRI